MTSDYLQSWSIECHARGTSVTYRSSAAMLLLSHTTVCHYSKPVKTESIRLAPVLQVPAHFTYVRAGSWINVTYKDAV